MTFILAFVALTSIVVSLGCLKSYTATGNVMFAEVHGCDTVSHYTGVHGLNVSYFAFGMPRISAGLSQDDSSLCFRPYLSDNICCTYFVLYWRFRTHFVGKRVVTGGSPWISTFMSTYGLHNNSDYENCTDSPGFELPYSFLSCLVLSELSRPGCIISTI
jgi:hypothetical protein